MKKVTIYGMVLAGLILLGVEAYSLITPEDGDTISEILNKLFTDYPVILYFCGIITGHIIFPLNSKVKKYILRTNNGK